MKYLTKMKGVKDVQEITKEEARKHLSGFWRKDALDDIFKNDKAFRLYTPYRDIWTMTDDGKVPVAGFYGIVGE